jgi:hypothetical protein
MPTSPAAGQPAHGPGHFVHCVFFTCKPGTPETEVNSLISDTESMLARIPSVRQIDSGRRDARMQRDVNETEYTVGLVVYFDDKAGHDLYNDHPLHIEYVNKHMGHWTNVVIYDYTTK